MDESDFVGTNELTSQLCHLRLTHSIATLGQRQTRHLSRKRLISESLGSGFVGVHPAVVNVDKVQSVGACVLGVLEIQLRMNARTQSAPFASASVGRFARPFHSPSPSVMPSLNSGLSTVTWRTVMFLLRCALLRVPCMPPLSYKVSTRIVPDETTPPSPAPVAAPSNMSDPRR